jgi:hypothetical protein
MQIAGGVTVLFAVSNIVRAAGAGTAVELAETAAETDAP